MLRTAIPADGDWHEVNLTGLIMHVATRSEDAVELWYIEAAEQAPVARVFRVYGTGQLIDEDARYFNSVVTPSGQYVWHLFERV